MTLADRLKAKRAADEGARKTAPKGGDADRGKTKRDHDNGDHSDIVDMLQAIPADKTTHDVWMKAGTVCKKYGIPFETFDQWSATDTREGEYLGTEHTRRQWDSFDVTSSLTSGWLANVAKSFGWEPKRKTTDGAGVGRPGGKAKGNTNDGEESNGSDNAKSSTSSDNTNNGTGLLLPPIQKILIVDPPRRAKVQVEGMWRKGDIVELVAKKKSKKSWDTFLLAAAVANGGEWFGHRCERGDVLVIDPELPKATLDNRLRGLCLLNGYDPGYTQDHVVSWPLRGVLVDREPASIEHVAHDLEAYIASGIYSADTYSLIIIDSSTALMGSRDENSAGDVRSFANVCLRIAQMMDSTVMLVLHEGKAKSGDRSADDRARGSSVWGDVADCQMSLCRLYPPTEEDAELLGKGKAYQLECAAARDFAEFETIRFITAFEEADKERHIWAPSIAVPEGDMLSTWTLRDELAERKRESEGGKNSGKLKAALAAANAANATAAILNHFYHNGITDPLALTTTEAADIAARALDRESLQTKVLKSWLEDSQYLTVYVKSPRKQYVCPIHLCPKDGFRD